MKDLNPTQYTCTTKSIISVQYTCTTKSIIPKLSVTFFDIFEDKEIPHKVSGGRNINASNYPLEQIYTKYYEIMVLETQKN